MCCCEKPNINGQPGYKWNQPDGPAGVHHVNPPALDEEDVLLYDEPGRCGGTDSHSFHFRVVHQHEWRAPWLYVRHVAGDERIKLHGPVDGPRVSGSLLSTLAGLDSNARYWLLLAIYSAHSDAKSEARDKANATWRKAAAEKRIKTRKYPAQGVVKVWIEPSKQEAVA